MVRSYSSGSSATLRFLYFGAPGLDGRAILSCAIGINGFLGGDAHVAYVEAVLSALDANSVPFFVGRLVHALLPSKAA